MLQVASRKHIVLALKLARNFGDNEMRLIPIAFAFVLGLFASNASAHDYHLGSLHIVHPWSRAIPQGASVAAGYFTIENNGTAPDRLISASADIAGRVQIHEMKTENGVMTMREQPNGVEIAPGATVKFEPNGYHLMLMDLKEVPTEGKPFMGSLTFEKGGKVAVKFVVRPIGATTGESGKGPGDMDHMNHMKMDMKH
jgi:periplasmic copper chaperone A